MTEKINGQGFRPVDTAGARRSEAAKSSSGSVDHRTEAADKAPTTDVVSLTHSGLLMSKLEELVQSTPVVDSDRVAALKDALASGAYEIDNRRIAERLLKLERDLG